MSTEIVGLLSNRYFWTVAFFLGGALISALLSHYVFSRDALKEVAFLRGQMTSVLRELAAVGKLGEGLAVLDKAHDKTRADVNQAFEKIRQTQEEIDELNEEIRRITEAA